MKPALGGIAAFVVAVAVVVAFASSRDEREPAVAPAASFATPPFSSLAPEDVASGLDAPEWSVGHTWSVTFSGADAPCVLTVVAVSEDSYTQASACPEGEILALQDAVFDLPHLGEMTRTLGGATASGTMDFFSWPLTDGKTWETEWAGVPLAVTATYAEDVGGRFAGEPGFQLDAQFEGGRAFAYDFVPSIGWWSKLDFDSGFIGYADVEVVGFEPSFEGVAYSSSDHVVYHHSGSLPPAGVQGFGIPDDTDVVAFRASAAGGDYAATIVVQAPQQPPSTFQQSTGFFQERLFSPSGFVEYLDGEAGQWQFSVEGVGVADLLYEFIAIDLVEWGS